MEVRQTNPSYDVVVKYKLRDLTTSSMHIPFMSVSGAELKFQQPVVIRHFVTRLYLKISEQNEVGVTNDNADPRIIFRLHSTGKVEHFSFLVDEMD